MGQSRTIWDNLGQCDSNATKSLKRPQEATRSNKRPQKATKTKATAGDSLRQKTTIGDNWTVVDSLGLFATKGCRWGQRRTVGHRRVQVGAVGGNSEQKGTRG